MWVRLRKIAVALAGACLAAAALSNTERPPPRPAPVKREAPAAPPKPPAPPVALQTPDEAVKLALADARVMEADERQRHVLPYTFYLWVQKPDVRDAEGKPWVPGASKGQPFDVTWKVCNLALAYVSRGSDVYHAVPLAGGHLVRVDLTALAPRDEDIREWLRLREEFAFDPTFSLLVTKDTLDFAERFHALTGRARREVKDVDVVRLNPDAVIDARAFAELQHLLRTEAPVIDYRYFVFRALSQIQDDGVFRVIYGGEYYKLRGIDAVKARAKKAKTTDQAVFFQDFLGTGNVKGAENADEVFDRLRSDMRVLKVRSGVTGKGRIAVLQPVLSDKEGGKEGSITLDIKDQDVDVGDAAYANLLHPRFRAQEGIFPGVTSGPITVLFNDQGALQDEVPSGQGGVADDTTVPSPHTHRLQPLVSCLRCHAGDGGSFWKPLANDARKLLDGPDRVDIFGELSAKGAEFSPDTFDRLRGLYTGHFDKALRRARDDYEEFVLRVTGPWPGSPDQTDVGKFSAAAVAKVYGDYWYDLVGPKEALGEWGLDVPAEQSLGVLRGVLPPDVREGPVGGFYPESPTLALLKAGVPVPRPDFDREKNYGAARARPRLNALRNGELQAN